VEETRIRDRRLGATRAHIAETALELFVSQGYAETTIDQIAAAAHVGRRTIFRHFATKAAILFDRLVIRREILIQRLRQRPASEPPLVSLHAVMRQLCDQGYDRRVLAQIRSVIAAEPRLAGEELWAGVRAFESELVATVARRRGQRKPSLESHALTLMAVSWFVTAAHVYVTERSRSLVECFDEAVATCVQASEDGLGSARLTSSASRARRSPAPTARSTAAS
jgi:AcrR family transcriptional regulator